MTQCPYCIKGHTKAALRSGATREELMEAIWVAAEKRAGGAYGALPDRFGAGALASAATGRADVAGRGWPGTATLIRSASRFVACEAAKLALLLASRLGPGRNKAPWLRRHRLRQPEQDM